MAKNKRKIIRDMLFEVYNKGVQNEECNLDFYYEKMMQALNIPLVIKSVCKYGMNPDDCIRKADTCFDCLKDS